MSSRRRRAATPSSSALIQQSGKLLLDTHVFLWAASAPQRLSASVRSSIQNPQNDIFVSAAVVWEIVIKHTLGKLSLPASPTTYVPALIAQLGFRHLPITIDHVLTIASLPSYHRDPFDRVLIAQARCEGMTIVTADHRIARYGVQQLQASGPTN